MRDERKSIFPFHYDGEAESYTFYRIPKILFTQDLFRCLSTDAKLLYGLLLDRMQLSLKNNQVDGEGKVFIYYTVENIMKSLSCGNKKAGSLLAELDDKQGIGLVTRVRQGLGKPDRIYVHKCVLPEMAKGHVKTYQNGHANDTDKSKTDRMSYDLNIFQFLTYILEYCLNKDMGDEQLALLLHGVRNLKKPVKINRVKYSHPDALAFGCFFASILR